LLYGSENAAALFGRGFGFRFGHGFHDEAVNTAHQRADANLDDGCRSVFTVFVEVDTRQFFGFIDEVVGEFVFYLNGVGRGVVVHDHLHGYARQPAKDSGQKTPTVVLGPGVLRFAHKFFHGINTSAGKLLNHTGITATYRILYGIDQSVYYGVGHVLFYFIEALVFGASLLETGLAVQGSQRRWKLGA